MSNIPFGLAFDEADAVAQATFWAQATGGDVEDGATQDEAVVTGRVFPRLAFHRVPEAVAGHTSDTDPLWRRAHEEA